jgi:hypothetical protein
MNWLHDHLPLHSWLIVRNIRLHSLLALALIFSVLTPEAYSQASALKVKTSVSNNLSSKFQSRGRIFLFVTESKMGQPRLNTWPDRSNNIFAITLEEWEAGTVFTFEGSVELTKSTDLSLNEIPHGRYHIQVVWDQNRTDAGINNPGNLYSDAVAVEITENLTLDLPLKLVVSSEKLVKHKLLKEINFKSEILSEWHKRDIWLKASVLLPSGYFKRPKKNYPVRYSIAGYGGRYTRVNSLIKWNKNFSDWWMSDEAPQIINVFLDGTGPFGDCYQTDSENNGPYGKALIRELIPFIEKEFRATGTPDSRFLDGCSTGGWVSLALQLFYPDFFNGCFSYSPDPVDFENFQNINIYKDDNAFYNADGTPKYLARKISGEPVISQKEFIMFENTLGWNDSYVTSGGQFGAFNALFSPRGEDGLPKALFDPQTGSIDKNVAAHWTKYDLKKYLSLHYESIAPKLEGKLWIWMGEMDHYYLDRALMSFEEMLKNNPVQDVTIIFEPDKGHCSEYSDKKVLLQIEERIKNSSGK